MADGFHQILRIIPDPASLAAAELELGSLRSQMPKVMLGAINKALTHVRSIMAQHLANTINVKRNNILKRIKQRFASTKVGYGEGRLTIMSRRIGAINFGAKDRRPKKLRGSREPGSGKGVTFQLYKHGAITQLRHAFIAKGQVGGVGSERDTTRGNLQVFQRTKRGPLAKSGWAKRFEIKSVKGLSLETVYRQKPEMDKLTTGNIQASLDKHIKSQVQRILATRGKANAEA